MSAALDNQPKSAALAVAVAAIADGACTVDDSDNDNDNDNNRDDVAAVDTVDITSLLSLARAAGIRGYRAAADDGIDVEAIVDVVARHRHVLHREAETDQPLLLSEHDDDSAGTDVIRRHRAARLLVDALILGLESHKLRWGMRPLPSQLKSAFSSADEARAVLAAVAALPVDIRVARLSPAAVCPAPVHRTDRVVHVVAGPLAHHLQAMFSPAVRRLRVDLALLGRSGGVVDDDDVYRGLARLDHREPRCRAERRLQDADEGVVDDGRFLIIDPQRLHEDLIDRRLRSLLTPLKRARVLIVVVADDVDVDEAVAIGATSIQLIVGGSAITKPPWLVAADSGTVIASSGALDEPAPLASLSVPSPLLAPIDGSCWDDGAFDLLQRITRARLRSAPATSSTTTTTPVPSPRLHLGDDSSSLCLAAIAAIVPVTTGFQGS